MCCFELRISDFFRISDFGFRTWSNLASHEAPLKTHSLVLRCPVRLRNRGLARAEKRRRISRTRIWPPAGPHEVPLKPHPLFLLCLVRLENRGLARAKKRRRISGTQFGPPAGPHERLN